jgi:hypothetical protein
MDYSRDDESSTDRIARAFRLLAAELLRLEHGRIGAAE